MTKVKIALMSAALIAVLASLALMSGVGTADAAAKHYKTCKALRHRYHHGVAKSRAAARRVQGHPKISASIYRANRRLDREHNGVACEDAPVIGGGNGTAPGQT